MDPRISLFLTKKENEGYLNIENTSNNPLQNQQQTLMYNTKDILDGCYIITTTLLYEISEDKLGYRHIFIRHIVGDAVKPAILENVVLPIDFHTCIALGTKRDVDLPPASKDTRVLCIMLLLRKLCDMKHQIDPDAHHLHVVGENQEDMTAKLSLGPMRRSALNGFREPDFVNTQAIKARVLAQTLAYPSIKKAIGALFDDSPCNIELLPACNFIPLNIPLSMGVVAAIVQNNCPPTVRCVFIGFQNAGGEIYLSPHHSMVRPFVPGESLVLVRRTDVSRKKSDMSPSSSHDLGRSSSGDEPKKTISPMNRHEIYEQSMKTNLPVTNTSNSSNAIKMSYDDETQFVKPRVYSPMSSPVATTDTIVNASIVHDSTTTTTTTAKFAMTNNSGGTRSLNSYAVNSNTIINSVETTVPTDNTNIQMNSTGDDQYHNTSSNIDTYVAVNTTDVEGDVDDDISSSKLANNRPSSDKLMAY